MKKKISILMTLAIFVHCTVGFADAISIDTIHDNARIFASKYDFIEKKLDLTRELYPDIFYVSSIEQRADGSEFELPLVYDDTYAMMVNQFELEKGDMKLMINDKESIYSGQCVLFNGVTLVPVSVFEEAECNIDFNNDLYINTITNGDTILEIMPNLIAMRKNQAEGLYVPLEVCARFVEGIVYVPIRAVSNEFGFKIDWDGSTKTVSIWTK